MGSTYFCIIGFLAWNKEHNSRWHSALSGSAGVILRGQIDLHMVAEGYETKEKAQE